MNDFFSWLNDGLVERGWNNAELARRTGLSRSAISMTLNGVTSVTWEFCALVANAFRIPPEDVFRRAGLLPLAPRQEELQTLIDLAKHLNTEHVALLTEFALMLYKRQIK